MPSAFSIKTKIRTEDKIAYIRVIGDLDAHTFEKMESEINKLIKSSIFKLIVDMEKVEYISSAGAGVFIGAIGTSQENSGNIVFLRPSPCVREVFELLGLAQIFRFYDTLEKAISDFP